MTHDLHEIVKEYIKMLDTLNKVVKSDSQAQHWDSISLKKMLSASLVIRILGNLYVLIEGWFLSGWNVLEVVVSYFADLPMVLIHGPSKSPRRISFFITNTSEVKQFMFLAGTQISPRHTSLILAIVYEGLLLFMNTNQHIRPSLLDRQVNAISELFLGIFRQYKFVKSLQLPLKTKLAEQF